MGNPIPAAVVESAGPAPSLIEAGGAVETPPPAPETVTSETAPEPGPSEPGTTPVEASSEPVGGGGEAGEPAPAEAPPAPAPEPVVEPPPAEPPPAEEAPPEAAAPEQPPLPTYEPFQMPEGMDAAPEVMGEYTTVLGQAGISQEVGQSLIDLHGRVMKDYADQLSARMAESQTDAFEAVRADFRKQTVTAFGNQYDTKLNDARWAVMQLMPDAEKRKAAWNVLSTTGAGDHPAIVELLATAAQRMRERTAPAVPLGAKPTPSKPWDARYGGGSTPR